MSSTGAQIFATQQVPRRDDTSWNIDGELLVGEDTFDKGIEIATANKNITEDKSMQLVYKKGHRKPVPPN
jgi:hypothetical protein